LICIFLMAKDVEHFFMYLLDIWTSSFANCLFSSYVHLLVVLLAFYCVILKIFIGAEYSLTYNDWIINWIVISIT
jgi:hypothetical protein